MLLMTAVDSAANLLDSLAHVAWPLLLAFVIWKLLPQIRNVLAHRSVTIEVLGTTISAQDASDQLHQAIEDLQAKVAELQELREPPVFRDAAIDTRSPGGSSNGLAATTIGSVERVVRNVLWVDDRPANNIYLIKTLEDMDLSISQESTTGDALAALRGGKPFDLIITDMGRAEHGAYVRDAGLQFIRQARADGTNIPIIVYASLDAASSFATEVVDAGAVGITASPTELSPSCRQRPRKALRHRWNPRCAI